MKHSRTIWVEIQMHSLTVATIFTNYKPTVNQQTGRKQTKMGHRATRDNKPLKVLNAPQLSTQYIEIQCLNTISIKARDARTIDILERLDYSPKTVDPIEQKRKIVEPETHRFSNGKWKKYHQPKFSRGEWKTIDEDWTNLSAD